jgi:branched-subunit amino acid ABC-type transport system permease component
MGISSSSAGRLSFTMAAFIGALSGLLIGPTTTVFYDSGFLIGLKGFVAAVFAGLSSYPLALVGALGVGLLESFGSFWASAYKEVIVFSTILPVLLWRSCATRTARNTDARFAFPAFAAVMLLLPALPVPTSGSRRASTSACTPSSRWAWCC